MPQFPVKNGLIQGTLDGTPTSGTLDLGAMTRVVLPVDQNIVTVEEDFIGGTNADGSIGVLGWRQSNIAGTGSFAYIAPSTFNNPGQYQIQSGAVSGNASSLYVGGSALAPFIVSSGGSPLVFELRITFKRPRAFGLDSQTITPPWHRDEGNTFATTQAAGIQISWPS
jgi:hypothetical protein